MIPKFRGLSIDEKSKGEWQYGHFSPVVLLFTKSTFFSEKCYKLTKKEVVSNGFGWVFDCPGVEVQEVE